MSRIAKNPITLPQGVNVEIKGQSIKVKGAKGELEAIVHPAVKVVQNDNALTFSLQSNIDARQGWMFAGTWRSLINNMVIGVDQGYTLKLVLVGVGYRASLQGKALNLVLGLSHPVIFTVPEGVTVEVPTQTEIVLKGIDKHLMGQTAAKIRAYRPPEPYKGKGIRFADEQIKLKDVKKK